MRKVYQSTHLVLNDNGGLELDEEMGMICLTRGWRLGLKHNEKMKKVLLICAALRNCHLKILGFVSFLFQKGGFVSFEGRR